jgi:hypothetical protein
MKNAGLAGAITLCGIGLMMSGLGSVVETPNALANASDDFTSTSKSLRDVSRPDSTQRLGFSDCFPGPAVTWAVFDPQPRPLELVRGADQIECWGADDSTVDFDGDGSREQYNTEYSNAGIDFSGTAVEYFAPFSSLRRTDDGVALEVVMDFEGDIQYWLDALDIKSPSGLNVRIRGFFDVDGDGLPDALLRARVNNVVDGNFSSQTLWYWFRNQLTPPGDRVAGDVNNDGQVNGADLTIVLSNWSS